MSERVSLMQGNEASVEGALDAGVRFYAGYPITPSSEVAEDFAAKLPPLGGKFIQMEDEIASMAAIVGASLAGKKAVTATSGPGFSLKQEIIGFANMIEAPCVVINVQRAGPSTGLPTSPAQGDMMQARWGTHGDHPALAVAPSSVADTYLLTFQAVNWAERFRMPVMVMLDETIGHLREKVILPSREEMIIVNRKHPQGSPQSFQPYDIEDEDLIPPLPPYGSGYRFHTTGLYHDETGFPANRPEITKRLLDRLHDKIDRYKETLYLYDSFGLRQANQLIISYGGAARSAKAAWRIAREKGLLVGLLILKTIWPFPEEIVAQAGHDKNNIVVAEMNRGQLIGEVERIMDKRIPIRGAQRADGVLITPEQILAQLEGVN